MTYLFQNGLLKRQGAVVEVAYSLDADGDDSLTLDLDNGAYQVINILADVTSIEISGFTGTAWQVGMGLRIEVVQPTAGNCTVTWPSDIVWDGASAPTLSTAGGAMDSFEFNVSVLGAGKQMVGKMTGSFVEPAAPPSGLVNTHCASFGGGHLAGTVGDHAFTGATAFSVSFWVKPATVAGGTVHALVTNFGSAATGWQVNQVAADIVVSMFASGSSYALLSCSDSLLTVDRWHHIAAVFTQATVGNITVYVNGVANSASGSGSFTAFTPPGVFKIGARDHATSYPFDGRVDEVSIWSKALSAGEVAALYNASVPTDLTGEAGLESWYRFKTTDDFSDADGIDDDEGDAKLTGSGSVTSSPAIASGLKHWWKLNDSASAPDDSGFSALALNDGGNPTLSADNSIVFDGVGSPHDNLSLASCTTIVDKERTFSFWLKLDKDATPNLYDMYFNSHKAGWYAGGFACWNSSSVIRFSVGPYTDFAYISNPAVDTWVHVACVCSFAGGTHEIYINKVVGTTGGTPVDPTTDGSSTSWIAGEDFALGALGASDGSYGFVGELADFRVYDRALTLADLTIIYDAGRGN